MHQAGNNGAQCLAYVHHLCVGGWLVLADFVDLIQAEVDDWEHLTPESICRAFDSATERGVPLLDFAIWLDMQPLPAATREQLPALIEEYIA